MKSLLKILFSISCFREKNKEQIAVFIRTDNIGDYLLFRNFLPHIRQSEKYRTKRIVLVGNTAWKVLAETFDKEYIDVFFWLNPTLYAQNKWYRLKTLFQINRFRANILVNTVHSRSWLINEIAFFNSAQTKITCEGDDVNLSIQIQKESDTLFDIIIPSLATNYFEFERNRFWVEKLLEIEIKLSRPFFKHLKKNENTYSISLFIGASSPFRRWLPTHFAHLVMIINESKPNCFFQILGGESDIECGKEIMRLIEKEQKPIIIKNLCGKTSLVDLINCINETHLLISNETSAVHIASATDTQTICISNGNHFGRFNPYPLSITDKIKTVYPDDSFYDIQNIDDYIQNFRIKSEIDINKITPERVFSIAQALL